MIKITTLTPTRMDNVLAEFFMPSIFKTAKRIMTGILGTSRVLFAMGRDREIPERFGKIDKFGTPLYSILLSMAISLLFVYSLTALIRGITFLADLMTFFDSRICFNP